jgi:hypothetical protein
MFGDLSPQDFAWLSVVESPSDWPLVPDQLALWFASPHADQVPERLGGR